MTLASPKLPDEPDAGVISRAQGCLLGQLAGDALGSLVEFLSPQEIARRYPSGVRSMADGGTWNTIAGQPTDDSEMALLLARMLVDQGQYDANDAHRAYLYWLDSGPFDCGLTVSAGLTGQPNYDSQANGAMMRISPLGIFGANYSHDEVARWARQDAALTHPHFICQQASALFAMAIARAVRNPVKPVELYQQVLAWADEMAVEDQLMETVIRSKLRPPNDFLFHQGWVLIAFQNALWQLLNAPNLEEAIVNTVMRGGDTDTNAAICGALLGAVYSRTAVPDQWIDCLGTCRPMTGQTNVFRPRPECMWPVDALDLAERLVLKRKSEFPG